jgi:hypothetical protein
MSDKILTEAECAALWQKLTMKYGAEMEAIQRALITDATVFGHITPATEARRQAFMKKILEENQVPANAAPSPLAVLEAEDFGKDDK